MKLDFNIGEYSDGTPSSISISPTMVIENAELLKLSSAEYEPKIGDKIYLLPGVNIPRIKLKEFALDYNIKKVNDIKEATVIFGSKLSNSKLVNTHWNYQVKTEDFKNCFEACVNDLNLFDEYEIEKVKTALEFYQEEFIYADYRSMRILGNEDLYKTLIVNPAFSFNKNKSSTYSYVVEEQYQKLVEDLENKEVLNEAALLKHINGDDAIVIDQKVFEQLDLMFESSDADNHVLAMEIMSNCKYKESLYYIIKLMRRKHNTMQNCRSKNHVNFKSLLSYLEIDKYGMNFSMDNMLRLLMKKEVLTPEMLNKIITEEVDTNTFYSNILKIKTITAEQELLEYFNLNYTLELTPDFIPKEIEIVSESINQDPIEDSTPIWT